MHYVTPFSHNDYFKSLEFYENYITLLYLEKNNFLKYYINLEPRMHGILPEVVGITTYYKQQLRNNIILWRDLFRNAQ